MLPIPKQVVKKDEGRYRMGPLIEDLGVDVFTSYASKRGANAYTFETFDNPLTYRVGSHMAGVEGGILDYTGLNPTKIASTLKGKKFDIDKIKDEIYGDRGEVEILRTEKGIYAKITDGITEINLIKSGRKTYAEVRYAEAYDLSEKEATLVSNELMDRFNYKMTDTGKVEKKIRDVLYEPNPVMKEYMLDGAASLAASGYGLVKEIASLGQRLLFYLLPV